MPTQEELMRMYQEKLMAEQHKVNELRQRAYIIQQEIDNNKFKRNVAVIVALDLDGGFSKNQEIPWHFSKDLNWFKQQTTNHMCIMGRLTYEDINKRLGEKAKDSVLPNRKCFVMSSTLTSLPNAIVVKSFGEVEMHVTAEDDDKTLFAIGGTRIFQEGLSLANKLYITTINNTYDCDKLFPTQIVLDKFVVSKMFKHADTPELRFTVWDRK